jgi:hypothetical protein
MPGSPCFVPRTNSQIFSTFAMTCKSITRGKREIERERERERERTKEREGQKEWGKQQEIDVVYVCMYVYIIIQYNIEEGQRVYMHTYCNNYHTHAHARTQTHTYTVRERERTGARPQRGCGGGASDTEIHSIQPGVCVWGGGGVNQRYVACDLFADAVMKLRGGTSGELSLYTYILHQYIHTYRTSRISIYLHYPWSKQAVSRVLYLFDLQPLLCSFTPNYIHIHIILHDTRTRRWQERESRWRKIAPCPVMMRCLRVLTFATAQSEVRFIDSYLAKKCTQTMRPFNNRKTRM